MSLKGIILMILAICLGFNAPSRTKKPTDPNEAGQKVFDILKKLDQLSPEKFARQMINIRDFHNLVKEYNITDEQEIQNITRITREEWKEIALNNYKGLKWYTEDHQIDWTKIKFSKYNYKIVEKGGLEYYEGLLEFTHLQTTHSLAITSIKTGNKIEIVGINVPVEDY
ncbi:hypothetical protein [Mangrovivirga cuniculi]|uniref:Uncharacterized protein n=1 Tax=Mangrovivirga cuniculi TaxID=2715131 RepID=A0A4D7JZH8_9BACT|nr:hypothetical protein [Mangrovivirga cuniculi]QCK16115.1 hypothetical protein DCC35_15890 [Mangrovivirga cuniculi]